MDPHIVFFIFVTQSSVSLYEMTFNSATVCTEKKYFSSTFLTMTKYAHAPIPVTLLWAWPNFFPSKYPHRQMTIYFPSSSEPEDWDLSSNCQCWLPWMHQLFSTHYFGLFARPQCYHSLSRANTEQHNQGRCTWNIASDMAEQPPVHQFNLNGRAWLKWLGGDDVPVFVIFCCFLEPFCLLYMVWPVSQMVIISDKCFEWMEWILLCTDNWASDVKSNVFMQNY